MKGDRTLLEDGRAALVGDVHAQTRMWVRELASSLITLSKLGDGLPSSTREGLGKLADDALDFLDTHK